MARSDADLSAPVGFSHLTDEDLREVALGNWVQLNKVLRQLGPEDVLRLLRLELTGRRRFGILQRLYNRVAHHRKVRELAALHTAVVSPSQLEVAATVVRKLEEDLNHDR